LQRLVREQELPTLQLRVVKIALKNRTIEYLLTSLCDPKFVSMAELQEVYRLRRNEETYFNYQKNVLEMENFSGKIPEAIRQDY
jgi:hypothetical protein